MQFTTAELRDQFEERATVFLEEQYGDEPFPKSYAINEFITGLGADEDDLLHRGSIIMAKRAVMAKLRERYLHIGGGLFQVATAVSAVILTRLDETALNMVGGWLRRSQMLNGLKAAQTGVGVEELATSRDERVEELLASLK